jgi:oligopeptide/dipeptide ABC transporter ATP-binding protein
MYGGSIVEVGNVHDVLGEPSHPYTLLLLRSALRIDEPKHFVRPTVAERLEGLSTVGCCFRPRCELSTERCARENPQLEIAPVKIADSEHLVACWERGRIEHAKATALAAQPLATGMNRETEKEVLITVRELRKSTVV